MSTGRQSSWTRFKAAVLMLAVLNVTVAPCAMAFDEGRHCPNCPPEREHEMAGHHGRADSAHGHHGDAGRAHGNHQEATVSDCESLKAQCGDLDDSNVSVRVSQTDVDPQQPLVEAPIPVAAVAVPRVLAPLATGPPPCLSRGSPRLHELHCVYRD